MVSTKEALIIVFGSDSRLFLESNARKRLSPFAGQKGIFALPPNPDRS